MFDWVLNMHVILWNCSKKRAYFFFDNNCGDAGDKC